jgi:NDP-sugar pyrophosphorylase family protein
MQMKAMILAAGSGTRLRPLTTLRPKPLFPVCSVPLLEIIVNQLAGSGVQHIMVNSHHLGGQIGDFLERIAPPAPAISHSYEPELLGTGGAIKKVEGFWGDQPFLVVNGDILHTVDLMAAYRAHVTNENLATLVLHDHPRFNQVEVDREGTIVGIRQKKVREAVGKTALLAFTGIHIISPRLLDDIPANRYVDIIDVYLDLAARGLNIRGHHSRNHYWCDIGTPEDYHRIHRDIFENRCGPAWTCPGAGFVTNGSSLGNGITLGGYVSAGKNTRIGSNCSITDTIIWDNVSIDDNITICNCIIGDGALVKNSFNNEIVI